VQIYGESDELIELWQWTSPPLRDLDELVVRMLEGVQGRVLDIGCGSGRLALRLAKAGFRVDGVDVEERAVALGRRILAHHNVPVQLYAGDIYDPELPPSAGGYDAVVCTEVLEHVGPWRELLARAGELVRPGGVLVVTVPRDPGQFSTLDAYGGTLRRCGDAELLDELRAGYDATTVWRPGWPCMRAVVWAYTRMLALRGRTYATEARTLWREPGLVQRLGIAVATQLLKIDHLFMSLPFGTHLVVRARRSAAAAGGGGRSPDTLVGRAVTDAGALAGASAAGPISGTLAR